MSLLEISPELIDVGIAVGVLRVPPGSTADNAVPNDDFFAHPDEYLTGVLTRPAQRDAALRIIGGLADPDGPPVTSVGDEQWVALASTAATGTGVTCGLFLVTRPVGDDLLVSLGGQVERTDDVTVRLAARLPLFVVSESGAAFAPGRPMASCSSTPWSSSAITDRWPSNR